MSITLLSASSGQPRLRVYLVSIGVAAERLNTISYGEERPAVAGTDEAAWSKNRRAQFNGS